MKFSDFILVDSIVTKLEATTKEGVIREMVQALSSAGGFPKSEVDNIIAKVIEREELGTTAIGRGIAIPHARYEGVDAIVGTVGISPEGVDFDSLDCEKVNLCFLLVTPPSRQEEHIKALRHITTQLKNEAFCRYLLQSYTREDILHLLNEADDGEYLSHD